MKRTRLLLLALLLPFGVMWGGWMWANAPVSTGHDMAAVVIPRGANRVEIGRLLESHGLIRSAYAFALKTRMASADVRAGSYRLAPDMSLDQTIAALRHGPALVQDGVRVSIPEGYTLAQMAETLQAKGVVDESELLRAATNKASIAELSAGFALPTAALEGYLFPDTYAFKPHTPPAKVLEEMLQTFDNRFARPHQQEIAASGHSLHEIVTIASLIEREAQVPEDRARIAGVIANRLKRHMRLQIDATVLYALGHHKSRVLYKDLNVKSPYNTYRHIGLPPGPIASPGLPCLLAAVNPEANDYLYYVARPNGAHIFSRTPQEHARAIRQVRAERHSQTP